jgi:hypothetical protein
MPSVAQRLGMTHPLLPKLKSLRLSGMLSTLEVRAAPVWGPDEGVRLRGREEPGQVLTSEPCLA